MAQGQQLMKPHFKAPEGRYTLHSERGTSCAFSPNRAVRLTLAELQHGGDTIPYVIFNVLDTLAICYFPHTDRAPYRQVYLTTGSTGAIIYPTCHDHQPSSDGLDLLIGLNTGDVLLGSLRSQLQASGSNTKLLSMVHFNAESAVDGTRCVAVAWVPHTNASLFLTAHLSGSIYLFQQQGTANGNDASPKGKAAGRMPILTIGTSARGVTSMAVSPDGMKVASTSKDGVLRIHELRTGVLLMGFKSYYGGLNCCAWTHDSCYVATGGEDDLVTVFGISERQVILWGEGHLSWVTQVAFDPWQSQEVGPSGESGADSMVLASPMSTSNPVSSETIYRLVSVGQDCQMLLWDVVVRADDFLEGVTPGLRTVPEGSGRPARISNGGHVRGGSWGSSGDVAGKVARVSNAGMSAEINPPVSKAEMTLSPPIVAQKTHLDPISDILINKEAIFTACHCAQIKCWKRPPRATPADTGSSERVSGEASVRASRESTREGRVSESGDGSL